MERGHRDLFSCQHLQKMEIHSTIGTCAAWSGRMWILDSQKKKKTHRYLLSLCQTSNFLSNLVNRPVPGSVSQLAPWP